MLTVPDRIVFGSGGLVSLCVALKLRSELPGAEIVLPDRSPDRGYPLVIAPDVWTSLFEAAPELVAAIYGSAVPLPAGSIELPQRRHAAALDAYRQIDGRSVVAKLRRLLREAGAVFTHSPDMGAGTAATATGETGRADRWCVSGDAPDDGAELLVRCAARDLVIKPARRDGALLWGITVPPLGHRQQAWGVVIAPQAWTAQCAPHAAGALGRLLEATFDWPQVKVAQADRGAASLSIAGTTTPLPALTESVLAFGGDLLAALRLGESLARSLAASGGDAAAAIAACQAEHRRIANELDRTVRARRRWFARTQDLAAQDGDRLIFNLLCVGFGRPYSGIARAEPDLVRRIQPEPGRPPLATPFRLRDLTLANRVVVSPMAQYSAEDGRPSDWHLVHLGSRAVGGAGLVIAEMTCVSENARITPGCPGLYDADHVEAWRRIVRFVHEHTQAKIGVQIGHCGRKGSTRPLWEGMSRPLAEGNWPLVAASPLPWQDGNQMPAELDRAGMDLVERQFADAATAADRAGFDLVELHFAHGYLAASFLSPLTNRRTDEYGGPLENRLRFPLRLARAVRQALPAHKPLLVRISAVDWLPGGNTPDDAVAIARAFRDAGCDMLVASAGQTTPQSRPEYGPLFQTFFAERIRREVGMPTMTVGTITTADDVNAIIAGGRADLCAVARMSLYDPYLPMHMMVAAGVKPDWPKQYASLTRFQPALPAGG